VSYIVIQSGLSDEDAYREFDDIESAVAHLEKVCNVSGGADARLCRIEPVAFEVKQYFKVEIPGEQIDNGASIVVPGAEKVEDVVDHPLSDSTTVFEPLSMVEASDLEPTANGRDSQLTGESRRGLFGR